MTRGSNPEERFGQYRPLTCSIFQFEELAGILGARDLWHWAYGCNIEAVRFCMQARTGRALLGWGANERLTVEGQRILS